MSIFKNIFGTHCDFFSDRVCRIYTVLLFLIVAVVLAIELQHTSPMTCWTPAYFTNQHYAFTVNICENSGDLYNISTEKDGRIDKMIKYTPKKLKYLPVTLAGQSLLFLLPWLLWRFISHVSGSVCNLEAVVKESNKLSTSNATTSCSAICSEIMKVSKSALMSIILCVSYILVKMFYGVICLAQMAILSRFLNINFFQFQNSFYINIGNSTVEMVERNLLPTNLLCDFAIRQMGNLHRHTVQCVMPVSEVAERFLYIIWVWLIIVIIFTALSGTFTFFKTIFWFIGLRSYTDEFVKRKLAATESFISAPRDACSKFTKMYVKPGMFLALEIVEENGSLSGATCALQAIWEEFVSESKIGMNRNLVEGITLTPQYGQQQSYSGPCSDSAPLLTLEAQGQQPQPGRHHMAQAQLKDVEATRM